jgi:hypothetical protein
MADSRNIRGARDRARINLSEEYEVRYWTKTLGVSKEELVRLVQDGDSVEKVRKAIAR